MARRTDLLNYGFFDTLYGICVPLIVVNYYREYFVFKNGLRATLDKKIEYYKYMNDNRELLPYEIDGIVFKVDNYLQRTQCGETSKAPKWSIAYKFKSIEVLTRLNSVSFHYWN
mgnify:CR=1 FL=1